jgi:hypothetical protein
MLGSSQEIAAVHELNPVPNDPKTVSTPEIKIQKPE